MSFVISRDADLKGFAVAFVGQAICELENRDPVTAIDAVLWLTSDDAPMWFECCDMPFVNGLELLASGHVSNFIRKWQRIHVAKGRPHVQARR